MEEIKAVLAEILQDLVDEAEISEDVGFFDMGISSITIPIFIQKIKEELGVGCDEADIFNYPNIEELAEYVKLRQ